MIPLIRLRGELLSVRIEKDDLGRVIEYELVRGGDGEAPSVTEYKNETPLLVVDSVLSGTGRTQKTDFYINVVRPVLLDLHVEHICVITDSHSSVLQAAQKLKPGNYTVLMLSGDTSIMEFINGLPSNVSIDILPIPMGTGNALASSLGVDNAVIGFQRLFNYRLAHHLPLYEAQFPPDTIDVLSGEAVSSMKFSLILSSAFHAAMLHTSNDAEYRKLGVARFKMAAEKLLKGDLAYKVTIDKELHKVSYFAVINVPKTERTYTPSPKSDPLASELHILSMDTLDGDKLWHLLLAGYSDPNYIHNESVKYTARHKDFTFTVNECGDKLILCCDGILLKMLDPKNTTVAVKFLGKSPNVRVLV